MFADDFDPIATLAAASCPCCSHLGLLVSDEDAYRAAPPSARVEAKFFVDPSIYAKCPACQSVMEWPGCSLPTG